MSQTGLLDIENSNPQIATKFEADVGNAIPIANTLQVLGGQGIETSGAANIITIAGSNATAGATGLLATKGVSSFDSAQFTVTDGFVQLVGSGSSSVNSILTDSGAPAVDPDVNGELQIISGDGIDVTGQGPGNVVIISGTIATNAIKGIVELATDAETIAGALTNYHVINPSALKAKLGTQTDHGVLVGSGQTNAITALSVGTNGQVLLGSTGADPVFANLSSTDGSIAYTLGAGTLDLSALGLAGVDQDQIYYVGKHGNDANSGLNIDKAVLTFGQALTLATAETPAIGNKFVIMCLDEGIYTENITCVSYVDINAPNATLTGVITCADDSDVKLHQLNVATGTIGVTKLGGGSAYSNIDIDIVICAGNGVGFVGLSNLLSCKWKALYVENGFGVGDLSSAVAHMHVCGGDIYISGTGTGIARANTGSTVGHIDHIVDIGAGATTAIGVLDGTMDINVNKVDCDTAYNVTGATAELRLFCNELIGTRTTAGGGTSKNWVPQDEMANGTLVIGAGITTDPVVATLTAGVGISVTNGAGSITIANTGLGVSWTNISASQNLVVNEGVNCTGGAALSLALPATSAVGDIIRVVLDGSTSWTITQGAGQQIRVGALTTTAGAGGSLASAAQGDAVELVCKTADTIWTAISLIGNLTIV